MRKLQTIWLKFCGEGRAIHGAGFFEAAWRELRFSEFRVRHISG